MQCQRRRHREIVVMKNDETQLPALDDEQNNAASTIASVSSVIF